jgi:alkanesulfonate monooxygenase SsuD/methylene tetrahydromethanopterin reductase-like flavin-dependent oxidoreductase (luciferase family)
VTLASPARREPIALGLALGGGRDPASWRARLRLVDVAEALGLHSVWLPEGHFVPGATASPLVGLAAFAARTRNLRLGTTSLLLPIHDPLSVATETATLDTLSGGRLMLGLGRGFRTPVFRGFGVEARAKRDRFDEALDSILMLWAGKQTALAGEHVPPGGLALPRPLQTPHPPLLVAAFGRKGLVQAATRGLPYLASPLESLPTLEENYAIHRDHLVHGGATPAFEAPVMRTVHVAANDGEARRALEGLQAEFDARPTGAAGVLARAARGRLEERVVVGTVSRVTDALALYRERLRVDLLIARVQLPGVSAPEQQASLERLAEQVLPEIAGGSAGASLAEAAS